MNALIVFTRNQELGKVKSRLSAGIGATEALQVYRFLLQYTSEICSNVHCNRFVFYSGFIHLNDMFDDAKYAKYVQEGNDLGERMSKALETVFSMGCKKACIIGSDCYDLTTHIIEMAFQLLEKNDMVVGPSEDGGYYLLGMKKYYPAIFNNKKWGTSAVLNDTLEQIISDNFSFELLPKLNDIDTVEDLLHTNILTRMKEG